MFSWPRRGSVHLTKAWIHPRPGLRLIPGKGILGQYSGKRHSGREGQVFWQGRKNILARRERNSGNEGKIFWQGRKDILARRERYSGKEGKIFWQGGKNILARREKYSGREGKIFRQGGKNILSRREKYSGKEGKGWIDFNCRGKEDLVQPATRSEPHTP